VAICQKVEQILSKTIGIQEIPEASSGYNFDFVELGINKLE
jgi:hypothetical protein